MAGGLSLIGFIASAGILSSEEQRSIQKTVIDQISLINNKENFYDRRLFLMILTSRNSIIHIINKRNKEIVEFKKVKYVETDKLVKSITLPLNLVTYAISQFYDSFMLKEEQDTIMNVT